MRNLLLVACLLPAGALAQEELNDEVPGATQAIQERAYRMGAEIALGGGVLPVDPFTKQVYGQGTLTFHFTDWFGWQLARGSYGYNFSSGLRQQLERDFQVLPNAFEQVQFFLGSDLMFVPFYGKSAVANKFVIHYEAYILLGGTVFKYAKAFRPGIDIGGGVRIFQNKVLSYRLEVMDSIVPTGNIGNVIAATLLLCFNIGFTE